MTIVSRALSASLILSVAGASLALAEPPARKPAVATTPFLVKSAASLAEAEKALLGPGGHAATLVPPGPNVALQIDWRHEENVEAGGYEVHDGRDHVFFVTEGNGFFNLGGELEEAKEASPGEWRSKKAKNTKLTPVAKGDVVFIPHGTVHGRAKGGKFTMLLLSFWPGGTPEEAIKAANKK